MFNVHLFRENMIANSPRPLQNRIFTPLKETTVNFSPHLMMASLQTSCFSEQKNRNSHFSKSTMNNSFHFFQQNSNLNEINLQNIAIEKKENKEVDLEIFEKTSSNEKKHIKTINTSSKTKNLNSNAILCQKFNILLEKNETLNDVLEKKIKNLHHYSKENLVLSKEIALVQKENAELQLELEETKIKISILEKESKEKEEIIEKFKNLSSHLEQEKMILLQQKSENQEKFDKLIIDCQNKLKEKDDKIEERAKIVAAKKKLECQLLIFIKETEKLTKVLHFF